MGPSRCIGIVFSLNIGTIGTYYPSIVASTLSALASMVIGFVNKVRLNSTVAMKSLKPNNLLQKE